MAQDEENGYTAFSNPGDFFYHVLSYLETPPYLRRALFPYHPNLRTAGALPSLDMPHHLRAEEWLQYREGVTLEPQRQVPSQGQKKRVKGGGQQEIEEEQQETFVSAGLSQPVKVDAAIPSNTRVTLNFNESGPSDNPSATAISPDTPREEGGYYWGFAPRLASSLSTVFTECPFPGGYDYSIGTSERGIPLQDLLTPPPASSDDDEDDSKPTIPKWQHLLIVFGGVAGLEVALQNDKELKGKVGQASELFDSWVNLVQGQGSSTLR